LGPHLQQLLPTLIGVSTQLACGHTIWLQATVPTGHPANELADAELVLELEPVPEEEAEENGEDEVAAQVHSLVHISPEGHWEPVALPPDRTLSMFSPGFSTTIYSPGISPAAVVFASADAI
jgi:hypothetical protein